MEARTEPFDTLRDEWTALAPEEPTPFLTHEWLTAWWNAFGSGELLCPVVRDPDGRLLGAACLSPARFSGLCAPANDHSGDWDVVAGGDEARAAVWEAVAGLGAARLALP